MTIRRLLAPFVDQLIALRYQLEYRLRGSDYRMPIERAMRICRRLCEREWRLHGLWFSRDPNDQRYHVDRDDGVEASVSLVNAARKFAENGDVHSVMQFAASIIEDIPFPGDWPTIKHQVFWTIQSNTLAEQSDLAIHLSDQTHQVPVYCDPASGNMLWLESQMLLCMSVSEKTVAEAADVNLAAELEKSEVIVRAQAGVRFGIIRTHLPFKAALILAPNLRDVVEPILGWPLFAVIPRRGFMYLYDARCFRNGAVDIFEKLPGLGDVVLEEYEVGTYPLSTEIFEITDKGVRAVAEYRRHPHGETEMIPEGEEARWD